MNWFQTIPTKTLQSTLLPFAKVWKTRKQQQFKWPFKSQWGQLDPSSDTVCINCYVNPPALFSWVYFSLPWVRNYEHLSSFFLKCTVHPLVTDFPSTLKTGNFSRLGNWWTCVVVYQNNISKLHSKTVHLLSSVAKPQSFPKPPYILGFIAVSQLVHK